MEQRKQRDLNLPPPESLPPPAPEAEIAEGDDHSGTERLKALADGLFAVVMTLLVLDLKLDKQIGDTELLNTLSGDFLFTLFFYAITFLTAGIYWYNHVQVMRRLKYIDQGMVWLNLIFFLFITTLPFTADLFTKVRPAGTNTVLIYSGNNLIIGVLLIIIWIYASRGYRLITSEVRPYEIPLTAWQIAVMPVTGLVSILATLLLDAGWGIVPYYIVPMLMSTAVGFAWGGAKRKYEGT